MKVHAFMNTDYNNNWDSTCTRGKKCINLVVATIGLLLFIDRSKMINYSEILLSDYRGHIIDIEVEDYFQMISFEIDKVDNSRLNSRKLLHKTKFVEKVEELITEKFNRNS